jgi:adenylyl cyclase-associated protein
MRAGTDDGSHISLEAAASRFEDIAIVLDPSLSDNRVESASTGFPHPGGQDTLRLDGPPPSSAPAPPLAAPAATPAPGPVETPKSVTAYQERVINEKLRPFVELTKEFASANVAETARH